MYAGSIVIFVGLIILGIGIALIIYNANDIAEGDARTPFAAGLLLICFGTIIAIVAISKVDFVSNTYYLPCELVAVEGRTKVFEDENSNLWTWEDDREYSKDTLYLMTMYSNDSSNLKEHEIQVVWELAGEEVDNSVG